MDMSEQIEKQNDDMEQVAETHKPVLVDTGELGEFAKTAVLAILIALFVRSIFLEPFNIPSSSMRPTLLIGDYLFVNKPAYGYSRFSFPFGIAPIEGRIWAKTPERGDVIVFRLPTNTSINYIKRVIGLPGDKIQVRRGRLYINDQLIERQFVQKEKIQEPNGLEQTVSEYIETLPNGVVHSIYEVSDYEALDDIDPITVPEGHYFAMGDNRDNSQDSRVAHLVGSIPFENIVGRADFLFFSTNGYAALPEFWKWPWSIRYNRLFMDIDPVKVVPEQPTEADQTEG